MFETSTFDNPAVLPPAARDYWEFMETNSAAAVMQAVCPDEWADIVHVLSTYRLSAGYWLKPGGNRGDIADQIDSMFSARGWKEARLDLETKGILYSKDKKMIGMLPPVLQEGYLVDNHKGRVVLDVEWNAKDGNLDRDLASYRSWHEAGVISAGMIITKDRLSLLALARKLWSDHQLTLHELARTKKLPIDLETSTTTTFDKAQMRVRRGVMGNVPAPRCCCEQQDVGRAAISLIRSAFSAAWPHWSCSPLKSDRTRCIEYPVSSASSRTLPPETYRRLISDAIASATFPLTCAFGGSGGSIAPPSYPLCAFPRGVVSSGDSSPHTVQPGRG